jgi:hypothetical protein
MFLMFRDNPTSIITLKIIFFEGILNGYGSCLQLELKSLQFFNSNISTP